MYDKTVTLFSRKSDGSDIVWYATVIPKTSFNVNVAEMTGGNAREYTTDVAKWVIRVKPDANGDIFINGKQYLLPNAWNATDEPTSFFSLKSGLDFDFFVLGDYEEFDGVSDLSYMPNGFYQYMRKTYDHVYAIQAVALYTVLPHFEIGGK